MLIFVLTTQTYFCFIYNKSTFREHNVMKFLLPVWKEFIFWTPKASLRALHNNVPIEKYCLLQDRPCISHELSDLKTHKTANQNIKITELANHVFESSRSTLQHGFCELQQQLRDLSRTINNSMFYFTCIRLLLPETLRWFMFLSRATPCSEG